MNLDDFICIIKDEDGSIVFEGPVHSCNIMIDANGDKASNINSLMQRKIDFVPVTIKISDLKVKTSVVCQHSWKPYQGMNEAYEYCERCGDKNE